MQNPAGFRLLELAKCVSCFLRGVSKQARGNSKAQFFSGGRRKNAVFSPREKSEFPLRECSVNLHYDFGAGFGAESLPDFDLCRAPDLPTRPTVSPIFGPSLQNAAGVARPTAEDRVRGRISNFRGVSHGPPDRSFGKVPAEASSRRLSSAAFSRRSLIFRIKNQGAC